MNKKLQHITLVFFGIVLLNFVGGKIFKRFDLTQDKRYTLSAVSKKLINKIDNSLLIKVYLEGDFPSEFLRLQIETRQFLEELQAKNSNIRIQFINPDNIRERLIKQGMMPSQLTVEENGKLSEAIIFPWAEISYGEKVELVSLLPNSMAASQEEQLQNAISSLEFSFANSLNTVTQNEQKKVAVLSGNGELQDIKLYSLLTEIGKKYRLAKFTLDSVAKNPQKTLEGLSEFDLAIIAKPTERFTAEEKLTLDQFITNGGKTLWMLDNVQADTDSLYNAGEMLAYARDLNLTDLLFSYGVRINNRLVEDLYAAKIPLATGNVGNQPQFQNLDWFYHPLVGGNPNHPITKNILPVRFQFTTQIDTLKNNIKKTPLLMSSVLTKLIGVPKIIELSSIANEPKQEEYSNGNQLLAVLLEGEFSSAYKNRTKPYEIENFKSKSVKNQMIIISDGDLGKNQILKGKPYDLSIDKWTNQRFGNKDFLINAVDYLLDDSGLINLRNKSLQLNTLNKQKAYAEKSFWQFFNIVLPLLLLFGFGFGFGYYRKKKYS
ncbi:protein involved in gliding motility GldG [Tenacibaculum adriaticum]|uniref:Protein involved in gliding motility GldG n=1 Tax=Tenacibaculum adriaticum TaxID=413713 RepID=A0A5S5DN69_9FLAO|nr:gliding motility-associated ABC transporter substrate-binding protein GldG [Tenacibaculum adriaticum]TYP96262.1 protein involved in gliding motility GldG [Tenacibaculum adriaticum]